MKNNDNNSTPDFLKGPTTDAKGLPLRIALDGERRLDQPYKSGRGFKLTWNHRDGVRIVPNNG